MKKQPIEVTCNACHSVHGIFPVKEVPKSFVCGVCGVGQTLTVIRTAGYSHKRNYPEGFWS